jgi:signal transduction histidine kinase
VETELEIAADLPQIYVDPQHVIQVLGNLISNAFQSMVPESGMTNGRKLKVSAVVESAMIKVNIQDMGVGIPPENMKKLFEPLFTTKIKGIGLGLAVSRKLTEANGGRIEVESEAGKGSTFTVYLPVYKESK